MVMDDFKDKYDIFIDKIDDYKKRCFINHHFSLHCQYLLKCLEKIAKFEDTLKWRLFIHFHSSLS